MLQILKVVLPVFIIIGAGYIFTYKRVFSESQARTIMLGVSGLLAVLGIGFFMAAKYTERWYQ